MDNNLEEVGKINKELANLIQFTPSVKITCKKPSPLDIVMHQILHPDAWTCGIHPPFEPFYRRIKKE